MATQTYTMLTKGLRKHTKVTTSTNNTNTNTNTNIVEGLDTPSTNYTKYC